MQKIFVKAPRTYELKDVDGNKMIIKPGKFYDLPDSYQGDITLRMAVAGGEIETFETTKQGDALQEKAEEEKTTARKAARAKKKVEETAE